MREGSGCWLVLRAVRAGRRTIRDISVHAHQSEQDTRTYLTRLRRRGLVEKVPAAFVPAKP